MRNWNVLIGRYNQNSQMFKVKAEDIEGAGLAAIDAATEYTWEEEGDTTFDVLDVNVIHEPIKPSTIDVAVDEDNRIRSVSADELQPVINACLNARGDWIAHGKVEDVSADQIVSALRDLAGGQIYGSKKTPAPMPPKAKRLDINNKAVPPQIWQPDPEIFHTYNPTHFWSSIAIGMEHHPGVSKSCWVCFAPHEAEIIEMIA